MNTLAIRSFCRAVVLVGSLALLPASGFAQFSIGVSINVVPPALPVYVQPPCPQPNFMWTPGYWAWDGVGDYYWVPGTWVATPQPGYLWTPGYWGVGDNGNYIFHGGYWGTQVGFYGGVNYGFGFGGGGFSGGEWRGGVFAYNTAAVSVNTSIIRTTYANTTVINNTTIVNNSHVSFNGGPNGVAAKPTPQQQAFASQPLLQATPAQQQHEQVAKQDKSNFASMNHGVPAHAAVARPVTSVAELQHSAVPAKAVPGVKPYVGRPSASAAQPANKAAASPHAAAPSAQPAAHTQSAAKPAQAKEPAQSAAAARPAASASRPETAPKSAAPKPAAQAAKSAPKPAAQAAAAKPAPKPAQAAKQSPPEHEKKN